MAVITLAVSVLLWGGLLWRLSGRTWEYVRLIPLGLPLSAIVNLAIKAPLGALAGEAAGIELAVGPLTPMWFLVFLFLLSPVFEELIKIAPRAIGSVNRHARGIAGCWWTGMALGIGFGLGEAAYLAVQIGASGLYQAYPWYAFTGFLIERTVVVFLHGFMTGIFSMMISRGRPVAGFLLAAAAHAVLNSGAMLFQLGVVSGEAVSLSLLVLLLLALIASALIVRRMRRAAAGSVPTSPEGPPDVD